jgi:hypothetical protein
MGQMPQLSAARGFQGVLAAGSKTEKLDSEHSNAYVLQDLTTHKMDKLEMSV